MKTKTTLIITAFFLLCNWSTYSQSPYLVKDINPGFPGTFIYQLTGVNNTLFFTAINKNYGLELWKSDGTDSGTVMVKDINAGTNSSVPTRLTNANGTLFFIADDGINGYELWKSDGTEAGTSMVKNIISGSSSTVNDISNIPEIVSINNLVYFVVSYIGEGKAKKELWKSDGTEAGTVMIRGDMTSIRQLININGTLFFRANDESNRADHLLWKSDGTVDGIVLVKNLGVSNSMEISSGNSMANVNGTLFFPESDGLNVHGTELWKSDGTEAGTVMVKDIFPGNDVVGSANRSSPDQLTNVNGTLFFSASSGNSASIGNYDRELWKSDGTEVGTIRVKDIRAGIYGSGPFGLSNCNGTLYFSANDGSNGNELWKSDGTEAGTVMVKDLMPGTSGAGPLGFTYFHGFVYFNGADPVIGWELFRTDGTAAGTVGYNIRFSTQGSAPENLTVVNNILFFTADTGGGSGRELWALGTPALSVEESDLSKLNISIYPNPSKDIIHIKNESNFPIDRIIITDLTGKKVMEQNDTSNDIYVSQLKQGLYIFQIQSNEKTIVTKFIKN